MDSRLYIVLSILMLVAACEQSVTVTKESSDLNLADNSWLFTGQMASKDFAIAEVIALAPNGTRYRTEIKDDQSFGLNLPGENIYAVYFLATPSMHNTELSASEFINTAVGPSIKYEAPALLTFGEQAGLRNTLRLAKAGPITHIDLGIISINGTFAYTSNKLDFDAGSINDLEPIKICHQDQQLKLSLTELLPHLDHGDQLGDCEQDHISDISDLAIKPEQAPLRLVPANLVPPLRQQIHAPILIEESEEDSPDDPKLRAN